MAKWTSKFPRKYTQVAKKTFLGRLSSISLANNSLMGVTQLALTWVGWPNGEKRASAYVQNLISTKVSASHCKSMQVHERTGQMESQVDPSFQLGVTSRPK